MDRTARRELTLKATNLFEEGNTLPAVSLAEFFEGNTDEQSIGVNLLPDQHIGLAGFRSVLKGIAGKPEVKSVYVELHGDVPIFDELLDDDLWPAACVAFVITQASPEDVRQWVTPLHPRDVCLGWCVQAGGEGATGRGRSATRMASRPGVAAVDFPGAGGPSQ